MHWFAVMCDVTVFVRNYKVCDRLPQDQPYYDEDSFPIPLVNDFFFYFLGQGDTLAQWI